MTAKEIRDLSELVKKSNLVVLVFEDRKAGLGKDMQDLIVQALKDYAIGHV